MNALPEIEGLIDHKYIINIKLEGTFPSYAKVAKRLLSQERAPCIQLSACGAAVLYLLKVSSLLIEMFPQLHKITYFTYANCYTCSTK